MLKKYNLGFLDYNDPEKGKLYYLCWVVHKYIHMSTGIFFHFTYFLKVSTMQPHMSIQCLNVFKLSITNVADYRFGIIPVMKKVLSNEVYIFIIICCIPILIFVDFVVDP